MPRYITTRWTIESTLHIVPRHARIFSTVQLIFHGVLPRIGLRFPGVVVVLPWPYHGGKICNFVFRTIVATKAQIKTSNITYLIINNHNLLMV
uniref:Similar to PLDP1 (PHOSPHOLIPASE D ZETA1) n=1 Tax=Arundo donax TaxID=35708 RepID=A0A0A9EDF6_ARUDO